LNALVAPVVFVGVAEFPIAIIFAGLLRPRMQQEGWSESALTALFPGMVEALADKGDEIARRSRTPAGAETGAAAVPSRRDMPPRGWLLSYILDFTVPVLVVLLYWGMRAWVSVNWLYASLYVGTLGFAPETADSAAWITQRFLVFGIPLLAAFLCFARPLRFGLAVALVLLAGVLQGSGETRSGLYSGQAGERKLVSYVEGRVLDADRSYFGVLRVRETAYVSLNGDRLQWYTYLMHGTTHHGLNFQFPTDLRRVATTYYHRLGPTGTIMENLNWFPLPYTSVTDPRDERRNFSRFLYPPGDKGKDKDTGREISVHPWWSDARLPVSLIGNGTTPFGAASPLPMGQLMAAWSEPPYATVGLGTGTMASYGRPFQHVVFYEIDNHIRRYSLPEDGSEPKFNYVRDALDRGVRLEIIMGDARLSMKQENPVPGSTYTAFPKQPPMEAHFFPKRQYYYRAIELDAFSSDAIPVHLITKEAIAMYFEKLMLPHEQEIEMKDDKGNVIKDDKGRPLTKKVVKGGGVLMVHTSNRHFDLVRPVTDVARKLGEEWAVKAGKSPQDWRQFIAWREGNDRYPREESWPARLSDPDLGRFMSTYVMIARSEADLPPDSASREGAKMREMNPYLRWSTPPNPNNRVWTDDFSNLLSVMRW
jgi:hypothetical protein